MDIEKEFERLGIGLKQNVKDLHVSTSSESVMKYMLIQSSDPHVFVEKVNNHLLLGWMPLGGVSIAFYGSDTGFVLDSYQYAQALVKN